MYGQGRCVTQDDKEAVKWYRKAAEQGDHPAQVNLGLSYQSGVGVEKNQLEAYKWLRLVNSQYWEADNWTCGILGSLSNFVLGFDLTAAQKKEADEWVKNRKPKAQDKEPPQKHHSPLHPLQMPEML